MMTVKTAAAPNLLDLLFRPTEFFASLKALLPASGRYIWLVLLAGLVRGLHAALSQRPVQEAMSGIPGMPSGGLGLALTVIGALIMTLLMWLLLWGLGHLGSGKEGRPAEVYGASFVIPLVISLVLLPVAALFPLQINVAAPNLAGLEGQELAQAMQKYSRALQSDVGRQPLSIIGNVLSYGGMIWQFYVAWLGLRVLSADRQKALRGTLIPLVVLLLLGGAFWLLGRALGGGA